MESIAAHTRDGLEAKPKSEKKKEPKNPAGNCVQRKVSWRGVSEEKSERIKKRERRGRPEFLIRRILASDHKKGRAKDWGPRGGRVNLKGKGGRQKTLFCAKGLVNLNMLVDY